MFLRRKSRNRMDSDRNSRGYAESVLRISGQGLSKWPGGEPYHAPSSQTCCYLLRRVPSSNLLDALSGMAGSVVRSKFLDAARYRGFFLLAFDATKQEGVWRVGGAERAGIRYQLEAKLLGPGGIAISIGSCTVKQYFDENGKINCELTGFKVLARRIKRRFPRLPICAVGDALYACQPVMRICEDYGWKYILTFKKGRTPAAYEEAEALMRLEPGNAGGMSVRAKDGRREAVGDLEWARGVTLGEGKGEVSFSVVRCAELAKGDGASRPGVRRERINDRPPYRGASQPTSTYWTRNPPPTSWRAGGSGGTSRTTSRWRRRTTGSASSTCSATTGGAAATSTSSCSWRTTSGSCSRRGAFQDLTLIPGTLRSTTGRTSWRRCSSSSA